MNRGRSSRLTKKRKEGEAAGVKEEEHREISHSFPRGRLMCHFNLTRQLANHLGISRGIHRAGIIQRVITGSIRGL